MKKIYIILIALTASIVFDSCMPVLKMLFGVSIPKEVTQGKIAKKIHKYQLYYFDHYNITEEGFLSYINGFPKDEGIKFCRVLIFKEGKLLQPDTIKSCNSERSGFVRNLQDSTNYVVIDSVLLDSFINENNLSDFDQAKFEMEIKNKEFVIILYWATFCGILNKTIVNQIAQTAKECIDEKGLNAKTIYVNMDIKTGWLLKFTSKGQLIKQEQK
jgi:hypothetical protein